MTRPRGAWIAAGALAALLVIPLVLGTGPTLVDLLTERFVTPSYPAAPMLRLATPMDGDGVAGVAHVSGLALAGDAQHVVSDVQWRVDDGAWQSVPNAPRGASASAFALDASLADGDHVVEARATDGNGFSLVARAAVRSLAAGAPPTVRIAAPAEGAGVDASGGALVASGTVASSDPNVVVLVRLDDADESQATVVGSSWSVTLPLVGGLHDLTARAMDASGHESLRQRVAFSAGSPAPPSVVVLSPQPGSSFGSAGSPDCASWCVQFSGVASGDASSVLVQADERAPVTIGGTATPAGLQWSWSYSTIGLVTGAHSLTFTAVGPRDRSAPRVVDVLVHTPRELRIVGDDAPRLTGTDLSFALDGAGGDAVTWLLDGERVGTLSSVTLRIAKPGDHELEAVVSSGGSARLPLYARDQLPIATLLAASPSPAAAATSFDARATDADGAVASYQWDFGDGATLATTDPHAEHAYARPGSYVASVTPVDDFGAAGVAASAAVLVPDHPPVANFSWSPAEPTLLDEVAFQDQSRDPDGIVANVSWDFGEPGAAAYGKLARHAFAARGPHVVGVVVQDDLGAVSTLAQTINVRNVPPTPDFRYQPATPQTGETVRFTDASVKPDGKLAQWIWDFGDGTSAGGSEVDHAFPRPGRYQVTLTVKDDWGDHAVKALQVLVADAHPEVRGILADPPAPRSFDPVRFLAVAFDREENIRTLHWDFGDGATSNDTQPTHRYAHSGAYEVNATAFDSAGQSGSLNVTLIVGDQPPTIDALRIVGAYAGLPATLAANASDVDGRVVEYSFDVGGLASHRPACDGPEPSCAFTFPRAGTFPLWVNATDDEGVGATAFRLVDVLPTPTGALPPGLRVESPAPGAIMRGDFLVRGTARPVNDAGAPVTRVETQMRNGSWTFSSWAGAWAPAVGTSEWQLLLDTRAFPDGPLTLVVRARDASGAMTQAEVPVVIDNARAGAPRFDLRVTNLAPNATLSADATVRGIAASDAGVTSVRWRVDEAAWRAADGNLLAWAVPLKLRGLEPGAHVLTVEAWHGVTDHADVTVPFVVAGVAPAVIVDQPPPDVVYGVLHVEGRATLGARVEWRVDNDVWRDASGTQKWIVNADATRWDSGVHTVTVKAVDDERGLQGANASYLVRFYNVESPHGTASVQAHAARETPGFDAPALLLALALAVGLAFTFTHPRRRL